MCTTRASHVRNRTTSYLYDLVPVQSSLTQSLKANYDIKSMYKNKASMEKHRWKNIDGKTSMEKHRWKNIHDKTSMKKHRWKNIDEKTSMKKHRSKHIGNTEYRLKNVCNFAECRGFYKHRFLSTIRHHISPTTWPRYKAMYIVNYLSSILYIPSDNT